jgi:hypothetical protein
MAVDDINVLARRAPVPLLVLEPLQHAALTTENTGSFTIQLQLADPRERSSMRHAIA